ncbi:hypothetical protein ACFLQ2_01485 [archaeon]
MPKKPTVELQREHFNEEGQKFFDDIHKSRKGSWVWMGATAVGVVGAGGGFAHAVSSIMRGESPAHGLFLNVTSAAMAVTSFVRALRSREKMDETGGEIRNRIQPPESITDKKELKKLRQVLTHEGMAKLFAGGIDVQEPFYVVPKGTKLRGDQIVHVIQGIKKNKKDKYVEERVSGDWEGIEYGEEP